MVTVIDYAVRENSEGEAFVALILQGDLEMVRSNETGRFYATARKCSISSTFSEAVATQMIGKEMPGQIIKQECDPYDYVIPETGETIELNHTWVYAPEGVEQTKKSTPKVHANQEVFSQNGQMADAVI